MNRIFANEAKDSFGRLIGTAHAAPIVVSVEEYERLTAIDLEKAGV
jgi:hypothetical protein